MTKAKLQGLVVTWVINGLYLGYPECCIGEFVHEFLNYPNRTRPKRKLCGTGYVPCEKCNKKSVKQLIKFIAAHRQSPTPFPNDDLGQSNSKHNSK